MTSSIRRMRIRRLMMNTLTLTIQTPRLRNNWNIRNIIHLRDNSTLNLNDLFQQCDIHPSSEWFCHPKKKKESWINLQGFFFKNPRRTHRHRHHAIQLYRFLRTLSHAQCRRSRIGWCWQHSLRNPRVPNQTRSTRLIRYISTTFTYSKRKDSPGILRIIGSSCEVPITIPYKSARNWLWESSTPNAELHWAAKTLADHARWKEGRRLTRPQEVTLQSKN